jgi:eukaryotic-like serine/threonine-protein kinase
MRPGTRIAERFEIEELAGSGGMGEVYRARDASGAPVAVKVLYRAHDVARLAREARALASLNHPGILRYVAHGTLDDGRGYLVTEWLDGDTLAARLEQGPLSVEETLDLGARIAGALGEAHRAGIVHRDLKPANIFLIRGEIAGTRILDFGLARIERAGLTLTQTGSVMGTAGYMAPEQARGERGVDAAADVFSLGCLLFRCLTGKAPFAGDDMLVVLLKIALEEAPRLHDLCPEVPQALDELVAAMLSKNAADRPHDGRAAGEALAAIQRGLGDSLASTWRDVQRRRLGQHEQRVLSLVLVSSAGSDLPGEDTQPIASDETRRRALRVAADRHKGRLQLLADGSVLITLQGAAEGEGLAGLSTAADLAARAARCALAIQPLVGSTPIAVVLGRGVLSHAPFAGEIVDGAVGLIRRPAPREAARAVRIDAATARLVGPTFDVAEIDGGLWLRGERERPSEERTLLGRPTTCVGRERELSTLEVLFAECVAEPVARAVLLTGGPGMGKSRLCHEVVRRLRSRGDEVEIWEARGDPIGGGSAFGMLAQILEQAAGFASGELPEARRQKLRARVARVVPEAEAPLVTELLGEIAGAPAPDDEASPRLRAVRRDPLSIGDPLRKAWLSFVAAECAVHPVVLVLEDLHWGDLPTVSLVDEALRALRDLPVFVLATGRPEVHPLFPRLWEQCEIQELRLSKLTRRAGERLAREALGAAADPATVATLVERADGNAFFLEELIRAAAEGKGDLPDTVLSMVQSRLEGMEPAARRVLRAASVFGLGFWSGGVAALVDEDVPRWLEALADREVISPPREGRFPGHAEHAFRHAMVREAAYAMLTEGDRALAHRLAGAWLEAAGEGDPGVLARHFELGGELGRAAVWYQRAAEQALYGNDLEAAIDRAEWALSHAPAPEVRASLLVILLEAYAWRNEWTKTLAYSDEIFRGQVPGSRPWCMAAMGKVWSSSVLSRLDGLAEAMDALAGVTVAPDALAAFVQAESAVVMTMTIAGLYDVAGQHQAHMEHTAAAASALSGASVAPAVRGWIELTRGFRVRQTEGDVFGSLGHMRTSEEAFTAAGSPQHRLWVEVQVALVLSLLGAHEEAEAKLAGALREPAAGDKLRLVASVGRYTLANIRCAEGRFDEARVEATLAVRAEKAQGNRYLEGLARSTLARICRLRGDLAAAAMEACTAIELLQPIPFDHAAARAELAAVRLAEGNAAEALALTREAYQRVLDTPGYGEAAVRLTHAEALLAAGDTVAAHAVLGAARRRLLERADRITDAALRASFLARVPDNARTLALAERELGPEDDPAPTDSPLTP